MTRLKWIPVAAALGAGALIACAEQVDESAALTASAAPLTRLAEDASLQWGPCPDLFPAGCEITVLHGDPAQPNADVFLRTPGGGFRLPPHTHSSAERMILVRGEMAVDYQGADPATLSAGEYAYGPAGLPHEASCVSQQACVLFIAFEGPVDAMAFEGSVR